MYAGDEFYDDDVTSGIAPHAWCESCGYAHPIDDPDCIDNRQAGSRAGLNHRSAMGGLKSDRDASARTGAKGMSVGQRSLDALRDQVDPDWDPVWCVDCGVKMDDGCDVPLCRDCADIDD